MPKVPTSTDAAEAPTQVIELVDYEGRHRKDKLPAGYDARAYQSIEARVQDRVEIKFFGKAARS